MPWYKFWIWQMMSNSLKRQIATHLYFAYISGFQFKVELVFYPGVHAWSVLRTGNHMLPRIRKKCPFFEAPDDTTFMVLRCFQTVFINYLLADTAARCRFHPSALSNAVHIVFFIVKLPLGIRRSPIEKGLMLIASVEGQHDKSLVWLIHPQLDLALEIEQVNWLCPRQRKGSHSVLTAGVDQLQSSASRDVLRDEFLYE